MVNEDSTTAPATTTTQVAPIVTAPTSTATATTSTSSPRSSSTFINPSSPTMEQDNEDQDEFHDVQTDPSSMAKTRLPLPKMPPMNKDDIETWFNRLNVQLRLIGATTESDKYRCLLSYLDDHQLLLDVDNIVTEEEANGPVTKPFTLAKEKLSARFKKSKRQLTEALLQERRDENTPPSTFLKQLERKAGPDNAILAREIWEDSLPDSMTSTVETMRDLPVASVAIAADAIHQALRRKEKVPASTTKQDVKATPSPVYMVEDGLAKRVEQLEVFLTQKTFTPKKQKQKQPDPAVANNAAPEKKMCHYHRRFGDKAKNCYCDEKN